MIVQEVGDKIYLLPAWPKEWDTSFKLHLRNQTLIEGLVKNGKLERFIIIKTRTYARNIIIFFQINQRNCLIFLGGFLCFYLPLPLPRRGGVK
jgi:hypothetical protein